MNKRKLTALGILSLSLASQALSADAKVIDNSIFQNRISEQNQALPQTGKFELSTSNSQKYQEAINRSISNKSYLDNIINSFKDNPMNSTNDEFNTTIGETLRSLEEMDANNEEKYQTELKKYSLNESQISKEKDTRISPIDAAYAAYNIGTGIVAASGRRMTANYMLHAKKSKPGPFISTNDTWASEVDSELLRDYWPTLKKLAFTGAKPNSTSGSFSGTYAFNSGDLYTALHKVKYTVTYRQNPDRNFGIYVKVSDVFDFDWTRYNNIAISFGNNYCVAMQNLGLIKPFKIEIVKTLRW